METKEYYTPTIEDLYFGYQFEYKTHEGEWIKHTFNGADMQLIQNCFTEGNNKDTVRTAFLCKQDIIDLGFIYIGRNKFYTDIENFQFNTVDKDGAYLNYFLQFGEKEHYIQIEEMGSDTLFQGTCKSKNELKKLMKDYLNIPI